MRPFVLIADDDDDLREVLSEILESEGYLTCAARDGDEAIALLRAGGASGAVFADLLLPGSYGPREFVAELRARCDAPIVVISGVERSVVERAIRGVARVRVLAKPFSADALVALTRELIGPAAARHEGFARDAAIAEQP